MPPYAGPGQYVGSVNYASWGKRVGATFVRGIGGFVVLLPFLIVGSLIGDIGIILLLIGYVLSIGVSIRAIIQRAHLGYDFGDAALGQVLINESSGAPLGSGWSVFGRGLLHIVDAIPCYLGYLWPLWDSKRQTFADKIMTTVVVTDRPQTHDAKTLWLNAAQLWTPVIKS
jgi:uncharacterized RDD family membrane protein YckC